jgi:hypothetical protein
MPWHRRDSPATRLGGKGKAIAVLYSQHDGSPTAPIVWRKRGPRKNPAMLQSAKTRAFENVAVATQEGVRSGGRGATGLLVRRGAEAFSGQAESLQSAVITSTVWGHGTKASARSANGARRLEAGARGASRLAFKRAATDVEAARWLLRALRSAAHVHLGPNSHAARARTGALSHRGQQDCCGARHI